MSRPTRYGCSTAGDRGDRRQSAIRTTEIIALSKQSVILLIEDTGLTYRPGRWKPRTATARPVRVDHELHRAPAPEGTVVRVVVLDAWSPATASNGTPPDRAEPGAPPSSAAARTSRSAADLARPLTSGAHRPGGGSPARHPARRPGARRGQFRHLHAGRTRLEPLSMRS